MAKELERQFLPKKSLGQNFLLDHNIARKIVRSLNLMPGDWVVEIGPGFGSLTQYLLQEPIYLIAVELDRTLAAELRRKLGHYDNFWLVEANFLDLTLSSLQEQEQKLRVVGNIPYHITSAVIFKVLEDYHRVQDLTLMIQREVAERVVAQPDSKDYGILSVNCQAIAECQLLFRVPKTVFKPRPAVESAVISCHFAPGPGQVILDHDFFRQIVKTAFGQRRKMLRNSLAEFIKNRPGLETPIALDRRPENLSVRDWIDFCNFLVQKC